MQNWSFREQFTISIGFLALCFTLFAITKVSLFQNLGWITYGTLFLIHPVWPKLVDHADHKKLALGCRIGGLLCIAIGLIARFGV